MRHLLPLILIGVLAGCAKDIHLPGYLVIEDSTQISSQKFMLTSVKQKTNLKARLRLLETTSAVNWEFPKDAVSIDIVCDKFILGNDLTITIPSGIKGVSISISYGKLVTNGNSIFILSDPLKNTVRLIQN